MRTRVVAVALATAMLAAGCGSWRLWPFSRDAASRPAVVPPVAPLIAEPAVGDVRPAAEARAACANYDETLAGTEFPRAAILRGLDGGHATVRFQVDGSRVTVLSVSSSDPAFGNAAADTVLRLRCRADSPTRYQIPFDWRSHR